MNRLLSLILLISLLAIGIIGLSMMRSHEDCLFGKLDLCSGGILAMINSHMSTFQSLFAVLVVSLIASVAAMILIILFSNTDLSEIGPPSFSRYALLEKIHFLFKKEFYRWLALFEHSPALVLARS